MKTYYATQSFTQGNTHYDKGALLYLADTQALYLLEAELIALDSPPVGSAGADDADDPPPDENGTGSKGDKPGKGGKNK